MGSEIHTWGHFSILLLHWLQYAKTQYQFWWILVLFQFFSKHKLLTQISYLVCFTATTSANQRCFCNQNFYMFKEFVLSMSFYPFFFQNKIVIMLFLEQIWIQFEFFPTLSKFYPDFIEIIFQYYLGKIWIKSGLKWDKIWIKRHGQTSYWHCTVTI